MDSGLYAAYTGLLTRTQALDTAANNLANVGTVGFRAQRDYFRSVLAGAANGADAGTPSQVGDAVNNFGVLGGSLVDPAQGAMTATGNPLDLALDGQGYFAVQTGQGVQYTRDGSFTRSDAGVLVTQGGEPVLDVSGSPMTVPSGAVTVASDGSVSVATDQGSAIAGQVGVYGFPAGTELEAQGTNRFAAPEGATATVEATPVRAGTLEGANLDAVHGTMQLILVQRQAEMMQKALTAFDVSFDKVAAEELGRV